MSVAIYKNGKVIPVAGNADTSLTADNITEILGYTPADSSIVENDISSLHDTIGKIKYCGRVFMSSDGSSTTVSLDNIITPSSEITATGRGLYLVACIQGGSWKGSLHILEVTQYYKSLTTLVNTGSYNFELGGSLAEGLTITTNSAGSAYFYKLC